VTLQGRSVDRAKKQRSLGEAAASARAGFGGLAGPHDLLDVDRLAEDGLGAESGGPCQSDRIARYGAEDDARIDDRQDSEGAVVQLISDDASGEPVEGPIGVIGPDAIRRLFPLNSTLLWMVAKGTKT